MSATTSATLAGDLCFHCGLPLPEDASWTVQVAGVAQPCCCPGCAAVAGAIVAGGGEAYYTDRCDYAPTAPSARLAPEDQIRFALYDSEPQRFATRGAEGVWEAVFSVEGIRCAACTWLIEQHLARQPGVRAATLNVATGRLYLRWDDTTRPGALLEALHAIGYRAYPYDAARYAGQLERERKTLFRQLFVAGLSMMQVMMYAVPVYLAEDGTLDASMEGLMRWASLCLTLPAIFYSARPFFAGAWASLRRRSLGMDVPVALGIAAAFGGSVVATLRGSGDVYFDSVTMFVFLLLGSRYLELGARRKAAGALDRLLQGAAESAWRVAGYPQRREPELVTASQLCTGDVVLIKSGEAVPADCLLLEGEGALDVSLLTGESEPQRVHPGAELPGGAVNRAQPLTARVERPAGESTLAMLTRLAARAGQGKPALALWADKVAGWFVLALLVFAAGVFAVWELHDPARAWPIAVAVLVVSCPCALSLAMPTALAAGTDALLRKGVLVLRAHALETLERTTHVVFDKTGTLTQGRPSVARTFLVGALREDAALQVAAALEQSSAHPLAAAFLAAAPGKVLQARNVAHYAGLGVEGDVGGVRFRLGSVDFVTGIAGEAPGHLPAAGVYLGTDESWLACFLLEDALRPEAAEVVERFRRLGKEVILLSGDSQRAARRVADELGIATAIGGCLPEQKLEVVRSLQREGAVVAMVGDGVNDAAVLHAANVSFALGSGAALAQTHADCVLLSGRLGALADAAAMARRTSRVIRQNLAWATLYNVAAIPAAAFGLLNPWLSGLGMSISSAVVVLNALRLRRA